MFSTLKQITNTKRQKLNSRKDDLAAFRRRIQDQKVASSADPNLVLTLIEEMEAWGYKFPDNNEIRTWKAFLRQSEFDHNIDAAKVLTWGASLSKKLQVLENRYKLSDVYCSLVLQWVLESSSTSNKETAEQSTRKEMLEQRDIWDSYAFRQKDVDTDKIMAYLETLFAPASGGTSLDKKPLDRVRESLSNSTADMVTINMSSIRDAIDCLLKEDLFDGEKRKSLESFRENSIILNELADVIRSDTLKIEDWTWIDPPVALHIRRHINGKYRVYMDEDIIQAIFLHLVGMAWSKKVRGLFAELFLMRSVWKRSGSATTLTKKDIIRRKKFLGSSHENNSLHSSMYRHRENLYTNNYFLAQLPTDQHYAAYDEDVGKVNNDSKGAGAIKHKTLRLITTELLIQRELHGECTYFQTDFKWFGPSIPHATLLTVMRFFHIPSPWLKFFETFLQPTVIFAMDGEHAAPRRRVCGIPMSHVLSTFMGELLLFVLDFAVNQSTNGRNLYRFFDDIHFFGGQADCVAAWTTIQEYTQVMGLELNREKSASITCAMPGHTVEPSAILPDGVVRWGFLQLTSRGQWEVNKEALSDNIQEMTHQLQACQNVFTFVHAYNTYIRFIAHNLGHIGWALGQDHAKLVMSSISHVQSAVSSQLSRGKHTDIVSYLRDWICEALQLRDTDFHLPTEFFYFPTSMGGLNIHNPLAKFLGSVDELWPDVPKRITDTIQRERDTYETLKKKFDSGETHDNELDVDEPFMSYEEYAKAFEERSEHLGSLYDDMLSSFEHTPLPLSMHAEEMETQYSEIHHHQRHSKAENWTLEMYGADAFEHFGDLDICDTNFLPLGLVDLLLKERMRWKN
ncbi:hypothetical protein ACI68E_002640 [Malassezia pachydermatis]